MSRFFELWGNIWLAIFVIVVTGGNILWLWHLLKCIGIKECNNRKCKYRNYCFRYKERITKEESRRLSELINTKNAIFHTKAKFFVKIGYMK